MAAFTFLIHLVHGYGEQWSQGALWRPMTQFAWDDKLFSGRDLEWFEARPTLPNCDEVGCPPVSGRLGQSVEGGGQRIIFAIGNYVKKRRPVHDWLMRVLENHGSSSKPDLLID